MDEGDPTKINSVSYKSLANIPFASKNGFYQSCEGRILIGSDLYSNKMAELDGIDWMEDLPSMKYNREEAASVYHSATKSLIVAGGWDGGKSLDNIELLKIDSESNGSECVIAEGALPHPLYRQAMTEFEDGFILTGGWKTSRERTNEAWRGILNENEVRFDPLPSMRHKRSLHFSFSFQEKIFVFGGEENRKEKSQVEIFDGETWKEGPRLPCYLDTGNGNAVKDRKGKIIIISNNLGLGIFDLETLSINFFESKFRIREKRSGFAAILI